MPSDASTHSNNPWQVSDHQATLESEALAAKVDLARPDKGLQRIIVAGTSVSGAVLGVAPSGGDFCLQTAEKVESFVRSRDLVANYPQTREQKFSVQVYWRMATCPAALATVDTFISIQTSNLKCFPEILVCGWISCLEALSISTAEHSCERISSFPFPRNSQAIGSPRAILVRSKGASWSYLELTHPSDEGLWEVTRDDDRACTIERRLGGDFQEKGVIRRFRVRGAFLARTDDAERAFHVIDDFLQAPLPLTV